MSIKINDEVVMKSSVIKRTNHSEFAKNFKGIVKNIIGNTADIKTDNGIRAVPIANLTAARSVSDSRTGTVSRLIID